MRWCRLRARDDVIQCLHLQMPHPKQLSPEISPGAAWSEVVEALPAGTVSIVTEGGECLTSTACCALLGDVGTIDIDSAAVAAEGAAEADCSAFSDERAVPELARSRRSRRKSCCIVVTRTGMILMPAQCAPNYHQVWRKHKTFSAKHVTVKLGYRLSYQCGSEQ